MKYLAAFSILSAFVYQQSFADPVANIRDFCRQMDLNPDTVTRIATFPKLDVSKVQRVDTADYGWSWSDIQIPNELIKREAIWTNLEKTHYQVNSAADIRKLQAKMSTYTYLAPNAQQINEVKVLNDQIKSGRNAGFSGIPFSVNKSAYLECQLDYGEGKNSGCSKAVNEMLVDNGPSGTYGLFLEDLISDVLLNPAYRAPLNHYAAQLIDHLFDPSIANNNAFDDLYGEFIKSGLNNDDAITKTMNTFAYLSLNGPELYMIFNLGWLSSNADDVKYFDDQILLPLHFIATIAPVLDLRQNNLNLPLYFLPPSVRSTCLNGKYYHFWMSAWWAWHLSSEFSDPTEQKSALLGSWLVAKSYQKYSSTAGRRFLQALTEPLYADYANHERRDLADYAEATRFGVQLANLKSNHWTKYQQNSVDDSFQTLMSHGVVIDTNQASNDIDDVNTAFQSGNDAQILLALPKFSRLSSLWDKMFQIDLIYSK